MNPQVGASGIFPLPGLPIDLSASASRRIQQRVARAAKVNAFANNTIAALNSLAGSFELPDFRDQTFLAFPDAQDISSPSAAQSRLQFAIRDSVKMFLAGRSPSSGVAAALFQSEHESQLPLDDLMLDQHVFHYVQDAQSQPIQAAKVALPDRAGTINMLDFLPPHLRALYADPSNLFRAGPTATKRARRFASYEQWLLLVQRMQQAGMVTFTTEPKIVNGVFAVPKDNGAQQRFIFHGAPVNAAFVDPPHIELPSPEVFTRLHVPEGKTVFAAKSDVRNFYFAIRMPAAYAPYFAMPSVRAADVGLAHVHGDVELFPCLTVLPMGWSHSVFVAQTIHSNILYSRTPLSPADALLPSSSDFRVDRTRSGLYIDDLILLDTDYSRIRTVWDAYLAALQDVGGEQSVAKSRPPSDEAIECIGVRFDQRNRRVGLSFDKLWQLVHDTLAFLRCDVSSGHQLAVLVGRWTWAALVRRPFLAVFSAVYRFIDSAQQSVFILWPSVRRELATAAALAPLLWAPLSPPLHRHALATDASLLGQGVVAAPSLADDSSATRAGPPPPQLQSPPDSVSPSYHPKWRKIVASPWRFPDHINVLEYRAVTTGVRWLLSSPCSLFHRVRLYLDSTVVAGGLIKGRTSSFSLLRPCRTLAALLLASGVSLMPWWVPSHLNPADDASRLYRC